MGLLTIKSVQPDVIITNDQFSYDALYQQFIAFSKKHYPDFQLTKSLVYIYENYAKEIINSNALPVPMPYQTPSSLIIPLPDLENAKEWKFLKQMPFTVRFSNNTRIFIGTMREYNNKDENLFALLLVSTLTGKEEWLFVAWGDDLSSLMPAFINKNSLLGVQGILGSGVSAFGMHKDLKFTGIIAFHMDTYFGFLVKRYFYLPEKRWINDKEYSKIIEKLEKKRK